MEKSNNTSTNLEGSAPFSTLLERVGGSRFSPSLRRLLPPSFRERLRSLLGQLLIRVVGRNLSSGKEVKQPLEDAEASASISIIIPVHDSPKVVRRCLASLERFAPKAEVILVDDASKLDETRALLDDSSSRNGWRLIRHPKALGHSEACRAGAGISTRRYLCLLNSDTVVTPWCWLPVVQAFEDNPKIGASGPSTSNAGTVQALSLANTLRHFLNDDQICEYAKRLQTKNSVSSIEDLDWLSGFALFIRRSLWEELGGFDPNLPDYSNDVDLSLRIQRAGYRTVWIRKSYIHHLAGESYGKTKGDISVKERYLAADEYIRQKYGSCDL
jgi:O-antigen biosynthesis protein